MQVDFTEEELDLVVQAIGFVRSDYPQATFKKFEVFEKKVLAILFDAKAIHFNVDATRADGSKYQTTIAALSFREACSSVFSDPDFKDCVINAILVTP